MILDFAKNQTLKSKNSIEEKQGTFNKTVHFSWSVSPKIAGKTKANLDRKLQSLILALVNFPHLLA